MILPDTRTPPEKAYDRQILLFVVLAIFVACTSIFIFIHTWVVGVNPFNNPYVTGIGLTMIYSAYRVLRIQHGRKK